MKSMKTSHDATPSSSATPANSANSISQGQMNPQSSQQHNVSHQQRSMTGAMTTPAGQPVMFVTPAAMIQPQYHSGQYVGGKPVAYQYHQGAQMVQGSNNIATQKGSGNSNQTMQSQNPAQSQQQVGSYPQGSGAYATNVQYVNYPAAGQPSRGMQAYYVDASGAPNMSNPNSSMIAGVQMQGGPQGPSKGPYIGGPAVNYAQYQQHPNSAQQQSMGMYNSNQQQQVMASSNPNSNLQGGQSVSGGLSQYQGQNTLSFNQNGQMMAYGVSQGGVIYQQVPRGSSSSNPQQGSQPTQQQQQQQMQQGQKPGQNISSTNNYPQSQAQSQQIPQNYPTPGYVYSGQNPGTYQSYPGQPTYYQYGIGQVSSQGQPIAQSQTQPPAHSVCDNGCIPPPFACSNPALFQ
jgi:hypothetical protein